MRSTTISSIYHNGQALKAVNRQALDALTYTNAVGKWSKIKLREGLLLSKSYELAQRKFNRFASVIASKPPSLARKNGLNCMALPDQDMEHDFELVRSILMLAEEDGNQGRLVRVYGVALRKAKVRM